MTQRSYFTMCATTFAADLSFDEAAFRAYLARQIDAGIGVYLGSGGNGETHAMTPDELRRMYSVGHQECSGKVAFQVNLPEEHTAEATIEQARIAIACGAEALHLYTLEGRHGYKPTDPELIGYFDDVLTAVQHPCVIAVNPTMGYIPRASVIAEIVRRHEQIIGVRLSSQKEIYMINLQDTIKRPMQYHWQLGSGALDPFSLGATLFAAEANILPKTFRAFIDHAEAGRYVEAATTLAHIRRFNQLIMQWGPCARWIKMCMEVLRLPGCAGGLRKPYLMPSDEVMRGFKTSLLSLGCPEIDEMARAAGVSVS